jgi:diguanylate cyclase (GGDEF)-like protein
LKKQIRIAVVAPSSPAEFFSLIWKGIWTAACELSPFGVRIESHETEGHDPTAQQRILGHLLKSRPDALALIPAHVDDVNEEIGRVALSGIPVITFNADAPRSRRDTYVGTDPLQSGALACELLGKLMHGRGTVASFPGSFETEHMGKRYASFRQELRRGWPGITEAVCHAGTCELRETALRTLRDRPEISGIYVGSSRAYLVAEAMEQLGLGLPCVGFDNTEAVQPFLARGTVAGVIDENPYQQGYLAVQQAFEATRSNTGEKGLKYAWLRIPSGVVLSANSSSAEVSEAMDTGEVHHSAELMVRQRTLSAYGYLKKLEQAEARIATMEETDPLTGLLNRRKFDEVLEKCAKHQQPLTLLMAGLNGFRRTNGGPGPHVSDEALTSVARVLQAQSRPQDYCSRLGGDEFCVLLPGDSHAQAIAMKERILESLAETVIAPLTLKLGIQVRIGIASMPVDAVNAEDLLVLADNAMYTDQRVLAIRDLSAASCLAH